MSSPARWTSSPSSNAPPDRRVGQISHAVIVSCELGLPYVVSATARIPDGALIEVNRNTGTVTLIEPLPA